MTPRHAYRRLLRCFGQQGWWPVTPRGAAARAPGGGRPRYRPGHAGPLPEREAAEVCLGAILTQNTAWANVEKALESLNRARAVDLGMIARIPSGRLQRLIRSSGFFIQKSRKLKDFARHALGRGRLTRWLQGPLPALREELLSLRGVGPETADSMLLYAADRPVFVVDAYTRRIGERLGWLKAGMTYDEVATFFSERLPRSAYIYQELHALLVALGKYNCRKDPVCLGCPLLDGCPEGRRRMRIGLS